MPEPLANWSRTTRLIYVWTLPAFAFLAVTWFVLKEFRVLTYDGADPNALHLAIITAQDCVGWAVIGLFPLAAGSVLVWIMRTARRAFKA